MDAARQSEIDRLAITRCALTGKECWPEKIPRFIIEDDPGQFPIIGDERHTNAAAVDQAGIPSVCSLARIDDQPTLRQGIAHRGLGSTRSDFTDKLDFEVEEQDWHMWEQATSRSVFLL